MTNLIWQVKPGMSWHIESRGTEKKAAKNGVLDKATTIYINISGDG